ncbi:hypothetical protein V6N12_043254 [Hibiscus sabdariffa]|uniref:Trichome birefringence-like N-terminal domain-containing protein n=1 Tax=Hibiscus sabdariffa TaxID=183260 RepID=A0ABR2DDU8_9ROSI
MTLAYPRASAKMAAIPRGLTSVAASVLILAMLLIFTSWLLVPYPIGSTVRGYFYVVDRKIFLPTSTTIDQSADKNVVYSYNNSSSGSNLELPATSLNRSSVVDSDRNARVSIRHSVDKDSLPSETIVEPSSSGKGWSDLKNNEMLVKPVELPKLSSRASEKKRVTSSFASSNASESNAVGSGCDLYNGKWFYDPQGPSYTNNSCPVITQMQNCRGNGRPDKEYENWRWKPSKCDLPRFDAKKFLELMRGKTLAFIGDSVARNQMESMMCLLWQASIYITTFFKVSVISLCPALKSVIAANFHPNFSNQGYSIDSLNPFFRVYSFLGFEISEQQCTQELFCISCGF